VGPEAENELVVLLQGRAAGTISQREGRLELEYGDEWRRSADATPLSLSLPLARRAHGDAEVRSFLWGLLPDNEQVLERWARTYQVSPRNPFALLRHVGEDCAGAAQFVAPDRVDELLRGAGGVEWLDEDEIGERLRALRRDPTAWHAARTGQFSLAGAQAKTALHHDPETGRWGDPWGTRPTTHILKPAVTGFDDHDLNEHLCLSAARHLGLSVTTSAVLSFAGERVIVIDRYDRVRNAGELIRVHQEDLCQALGVPPTQKYENEGGPSVEQIARLLRTEIRPSTTAVETVERFVDALAFNWIVGGSDAHAKNYSLLLAGRQVRLAPLYDIASALPYEDLYRPKLRLAMRIGGEYRMAQVGARHWSRLALAVDLDPEALLARVDRLAAQVPDAFGQASADDAVRALTSALPARLLDAVATNAQACRDALKVATR
jgi:serine/threonine-protein kinase HipA